jgi:TonB family protein
LWFQAFSLEVVKMTRATVTLLSTSRFIYYFGAMKRTLILLSTLFLFTTCHIHAQSTGADTLASFPGGDEAFQKYISRQLQTTSAASAAQINGDVEMSFVIDEKGIAGEFKPIRRLGYGLEDQVVRILRAMPRWQPGVISGRRIKTTFERKFYFSTGMKVSETSAAITRSMLPDAPAFFGEQEGDLAVYITKHFVWPAAAPKNINGAVVLQFKIDDAGHTTDVQIITGILPELDDAVVKLVKGMPAWAAKQANFKPAASYKELTIGLKNKKALLY